MYRRDQRGDLNAADAAPAAHVCRAGGLLAVQLDGAFLWGFLTLIWLSVAGMLLQLHPQGYTFMLILGILNLIFGVLSILGGSSWESMGSIIIISAIVVIYCLLPARGGRSAYPRKREQRPRTARRTASP